MDFEDLGQEHIFSAKKEEDPGRPNSVEEILQVIRKPKIINLLLGMYTPKTQRELE